ncbi:hypothetical protein FEM48_Zijuj10G0064300 [Ziziphus jujuba var. spinosa]|uniref:Cytochrome P450 CYP749A22-like n=1 Tax=Ziziphus jujuba var. spinosa TaxID=714518 RepID=A0A978ULU3_ZIZJJ|nr:hypothetical protein FEM48_Zijuj10G0064300 [Ziziphus jujuba var. spinosa]
MRNQYARKKNECLGKSCNNFLKLSGSVFSMDFHQSGSQTMVASYSYAEADAFTRNQRPFLQIHPWKYQRNFVYEKQSYGKTHEFIPQRIANGSASHCFLGQNIRLEQLGKLAYQNGILQGMSPAMITSVENMLERWKSYKGKAIEVYEEFRLFTSDVISRTAFGNNYQKGKNIFETLVRLIVLASDNIYKLRFPGISEFFKTNNQIELDMLDSQVRNNIIEVIKKRERKVITGKEDNFGSDFLGLLLKAHHNAADNERISIKTVVDECKTFYSAGQETTNSLLAWVVLLLAIHKDWQEELRNEVFNLFGKQNPNPDNSAKLKKMGMVFNETLRLYPPAISLKRKVEREVRVGKYILPANLNLFLSALPVHHDSKIWGEDVHEFKPERFSQGVVGATNNNPAAFFPFGMGPRNCVGSNFAIIESKIALCMILQRYSFTLSPTYVHMPYHLVTTRPMYGIQVILEPL